MAAARTKIEKAPPGPDDLVRESAGTYRTGDGRFEVQKSAQGWFLVDSEQSNEFGQQLIHGPMPTLEAIKEAIPGSRDLKPLLRVRGAGSAKRAARSAKEVRAAPPPPSWIDKLPETEARKVRQLIKALEGEGLDDAELLVRRGRGAATPVIATHVIEHRLRALVSQQPEQDRERAHRLVRQVAKILADDGTTNGPPAPRWALVELMDNDPPAASRVRPRP